MIKGPRFQIVKQFFPMAASGSLAGGAGSRALSWASIQACHMVRARPRRAPRGLCSCSPRRQRTIALPSAMSHQAEVLPKQPGQGGLEVDDCSPTLSPDSFVSICSLARGVRPRLEGKPRTPLSSRVAAQTKRWAEGIRVPGPLAGGGSTTARGILRLCGADFPRSGFTAVFLHSGC